MEIMRQTQTYEREQESKGREGRKMADTEGNRCGGKSTGLGSR